MIIENISFVNFHESMLPDLVSNPVYSDVLPIAL